MFYEYDITVAASTTEAAPTKLSVKLQQGILTKAMIQFPSGCAGLAHIRAKRGGLSLWPKNGTDNLKGDNVVIPIDAYERITAGNNVIDFYAWNTDDTYSHTITVRMIVLDEILVNPTKMFTDIRSSLILLLRRIGITG